jgi:hypothetical protein
MRNHGVLALVLTLAAACGDDLSDPAATLPADRTALASDPAELIPPALHFEPEALAFGTLELGQARQETFKLVNDGKTPAPIGPLAAAGAGFTILATSCGAVLPPYGSCETRIHFEPGTPGTHAGSLSLTADGQPYTAAVSGAGAWRVTVETIGGGGTITSVPEGISCGATCSALFTSPDVVLTASAPTGTAIAWSQPGCSGTACTIQAQPAPVAVTATFGASLLAIDFTGGQPGEVQLRTFDLPAATCTDDCVVPLLPGRQYQLIAVTPSKSQLAGVCSGPAVCSFTAATGVQNETATFSLDTTAKEEWSVVLPGALHTAAFDSTGHLIVGGAGRVHKLSPSGATVWSAPVAPTALAVGPGDTIYVHAGTSLVKLDPAGGVIWTRTIPSGSNGCVANPVLPELTFVHCLAVAPDGAVAVHGTTRMARWDAAGTLTWTRVMPDDAYFTVAIDGQGNVYGTIESLANFEQQDAMRFAPSGASLPTITGFCNQYHGMISTGFDGQPFCTSSGHGRVYGVGSQVVSDPDFVPTGMAKTGIGDAGWVYYLSDSSLPFGLSYRMARYNASGGLVWQKLGGLTDMFSYYFGTQPLDIAGSSTGRLALVGMFIDPTGEIRGWVTSFAP